MKECANDSLDDSKRNQAIQVSQGNKPEQEHRNVKSSQKNIDFSENEDLHTNDRQDNVAVIARVKGNQKMIVKGLLEGSAITWKLDTGSRRTFITEESYNSIMPDSRPVLSRVDTQFETADGSILKVLGTADMNISFGEFCVAFPVCVGGVKLNLLGEDFISTFRCQWNFDTKSLDINGYRNPLGQDCVNIRTSRVIAMETIEIPARHEVVVKAKLTRNICDKDSENVFGVLCPDSNFMKKYRLAVARVLVNASQKHFYSRIFNPCDSDVILYKGSHIGLFVPAEKIIDQEELLEESCVCHVQEKDKDVSRQIPAYMIDMYKKGIENLTESESEKFKEVLLDYKDTFFNPAGEPGRTTLGMHSIKLKDDTPVKEPPRRVPLYKRQVIDDEIKKLEDKRLIEKSNSPWSSGLVLVQKKDLSWRLCVDYRKLNEKTIKDAYPIPRIEDNIDALCGANWMSVLDLNMAYHQVPMNPADKEKTAFSTPRGGLYQYVTMPFGLCNAGATFQRIIETALRGLQWHILVLYLDDIIVFSKTFEEHLVNLQKVFQRLSDAGLKLKASKCSFFKREVEYLGHIVSTDGVRTDPSKVQAVVKMKPPTSVSELRTYIGLMSYYRRFIKDFSKIAKCLFDLLHLKAPWNWTTECENAFCLLKEKLSTSPVLGYPQVDGGEFILDTDASQYGIGAVLSQIQDGQERVIGYASRTLNKAERNYCVTRKELLAVVYFIKYFRHYLLGRHFKLRTDHGSLTWLYKFKDPDGQVMRWIQQLSCYDFKIVHRPGTKHGNADALSRIVVNDQEFCKQCNLPWNYVYHDIKDICDSVKPSDNSNRMNLTDLKCEPSDITHSQIISAIDENVTDEVNSEDLRTKRGPKRNAPLRAKGRKKPAMDISPEAIYRMQADDPDLGPVLKFKEDSEEKPTIDSIVHLSQNTKFWISRWNLLKVINSMLCEYWEDSLNNARWRICAPSELQKYVLWQIHDSPVSGHQGINRTWQKAKMCPFYWKGMRQSVIDYVKSCDICEEKKDPRFSKRHQLKSYIAGGRFERIGTDIAGPFPISNNGNVYVLVIEDYFTKLTEIFPIPNMEAKTVADVMLKGWIKRYGCPLELHSDQGRQYESQLFQSVCKFLEIDKTRTTPGHPRSDGLVERSNRTIKDMLAKYVRFDQKNWDDCIDFVAMAYNATPHQSTGISPFRMIFGEEMRMPLDVITAEDLCDNCSEYVNEHDYVTKLRENLERIHRIARDSLSVSAERQKRHYDKNVKRLEYDQGDLVRRYQPRTSKGVKKKLSRLWTGPWVIVEKLTDVLYKIKHSQTSPPSIVHADNLKLYRGNVVPKWYKPQKTIIEAEAPNLRGFENMQHVPRNDTYQGTGMDADINIDSQSYNGNETQSQLGDDSTDISDQIFAPPDNQTDGSDKHSIETAQLSPAITPSTPPATYIYRTRVGRTIKKPLKFQ